MMNNKTIAKYELSFIGGKPEVNRFYNADNTKSIDVLSVNDAESDRTTCATIGLNDVDIGLTVEDKSLRVELIATAYLEADQLGCIISSIAFDIIDAGVCTHGMVIPNVVNAYIKDTEMKHALLMSPVFWPEYKTLEDDDSIVAWLMMIPISDSERTYIEKNGIDSFDRLIELKKSDVLDYNRKSLI